MTATVLRQTAGGGGTEEGHFEWKQDQITGEPIRVWVPGDDPDTVDVDESVIPCQVNAIITGGLNSQGTTERWTSKGEYENVDFVELRFPPGYHLTKRDRIADIRGVDGEILWTEEELEGNPGTVFNVQGVAPSLDVFNKHIENFALLARAENQNRGELVSSG